MPVRPRRSARPTRPASATPSAPASSPGLPGGSTCARCAEVGSMLATYVIETVGTQEYTLGRAGSSRASPRPTGPTRPPRSSRTSPARPLSRDRRARSSRRRAARDASTRSTRPTPGRTWSASAPTSRPGTLLAAYRTRPVPDGARRRRRPPLGWWSPGPPRGAAAGRAAGQPVAAPLAARTSRSGSTPPSRDVVAALRRPLPRRPLDHPGRSSRAYTGCTGSAGRTRVECWRDGELVGRAVRGRDRRPVRGGVDVPPRRPTPPRSRWSALVDIAGRRRRPAPPARRPVAHAATWRASGVVELPARGVPRGCSPRPSLPPLPARRAR